MISIVRNCHIRPFSSPIIICREIFFYRENKAAEILSLFFSFISFNSHRTCGTHHCNFWFLSNSFNQIDIVRPMTPNLSANFSCDWIGFSLSDSSDSPLSNFFGLSKRSSSSKLKFPTLNLSYHFFYVL